MSRSGAGAEWRDLAEENVKEPFYFIRRTKDVQLSAQLHFGPGALLPVILLQACDEVIFCVSSGYAHTCARLALQAVKRAMHSSK